eukprot:SAG25_NODE_38_length_19656_cov_132.022038_21_plen_159_part_01
MNERTLGLTNSAGQEAGLFQNIQTVPLCWNGAESLLAVAAGSRGHLTASPAMVTGAVAEMPSTLPLAVRVIGPHLAPCPRPAKGSWHAATHVIDLTNIYLVSYPFRHSPRLDTSLGLELMKKGSHSSPICPTPGCCQTSTCVIVTSAYVQKSLKLFWRA